MVFDGARGLARGFWTTLRHAAQPPTTLSYPEVKRDLLRWRDERFRALIADGSGLVALSYRGYGGSSGRPTETGLLADAAAALLGFRLLAGRGGGISVIFKDVRAEFLKRAEADVHFACEQGREIAALLEGAEKSGERENLLVRVVATVPEISGDEPVARFELTLSVKKRL